MLRTHRYGDQGNLGRQDHLKDHVGEATSKRKGKQGTGKTPKNSIGRVLELTFDL